jgi:predicted acyltransferase
MLNPRAERNGGLDAARGLAMGLMVLVNNAGDWSHVYGQLRHAEWHGFTLADLVFPLFLWVSGASAAWSLARVRAARAAGEPVSGAWGRASRRAGILFGLGLALNFLPACDPSSLRIMGVLQRIALVALFLHAWARLVPARFDLAGALLLLAAWSLLLAVPEGGLDPATNLGARLDRLVFTTAHLYRGAEFDPEGLLSTMGACATGLLGLATGEALRSRGAATARVRTCAFGAALLATGLALSPWVPVNKPLWTSSYVLVAAGLCAWIWAALDAASAWRPWRAPHLVLSAMGRNALLLYVGSGLLARFLAWWKPSGAEGGSARVLLHEALFGDMADPRLGSLLFAAANLLAWCPLLVWLDRRGWRWSA